MRRRNLRTCMVNHTRNPSPLLLQWRPDASRPPIQPMALMINQHRSTTGTLYVFRSHSRGVIPHRLGQSGGDKAPCEPPRFLLILPR